MKKLFMLASVLFSFAMTDVFADGLTLFNAEVSAQNHCPYEEVVWLNLPTHIWHVQGARWYGRTKNGAYVCKSEAVVNGNRESFNGS